MNKDEFDNAVSEQLWKENWLGELLAEHYKTTGKYVKNLNIFVGEGYVATVVDYWSDE